MGSSRRLKELNPAVRCISVEPDEPWHGLEGLKHMETSIVPGIYDPGLADGNVGVSTEDAYDVARRLATTEGILIGHSSGAALHVAGSVGRALAADGQCGVIVIVFADGGDRYLSSGLYRQRDR
jgi:cysteine synthase B